MSYTYSFDKVRSTLSPSDFIQEQNNEWESDSDEGFDYIQVSNFDPDEIL